MGRFNLYIFFYLINIALALLTSSLVTFSPKVPFVFNLSKKNILLIIICLISIIVVDVTNNSIATFNILPTLLFNKKLNLFIKLINKIVNPINKNIRIVIIKQS